MAWLIISSAAFEPAYRLAYGPLILQVMEPIFTMVPLALRRSGAKAWVVERTPKTLMSKRCFAVLRSASNIVVVYAAWNQCKQLTQRILLTV